MSRPARPRPTIGRQTGAVGLLERATRLAHRRPCSSARNQLKIFISCESRARYETARPEHQSCPCRSAIDQSRPTRLRKEAKVLPVNVNKQRSKRNACIAFAHVAARCVGVERVHCCVEMRCRGQRCLAVGKNRPVRRTPPAVYRALFCRSAVPLRSKMADSPKRLTRVRSRSVAWVVFSGTIEVPRTR